MIKKIEHIENFGIFHNYKDSDLPEFKKYNLIYGWNASGKTTLSKLFQLLPSGSHEDFKELKYKVSLSNSNDILKENEPYIGREIKVFNREYIEENVNFKEGSVRPILILGKENKEISDRIKINEALLKKKREELKQLEDNKERKEKDVGKEFTNIARTISAIFKGEATRNYNKAKAEKHFDQLFENEDDHSKFILTKERQEEILNQIHREEKSEISLIQENKVNSDLKNLSVQLNDVENICKTIVKKIAIDRLKNNSDIQDWVKEGFDLHDKHKSKNCEFCTQTISKDRLNQLESFFNDEDRRIRKRIEETSKAIRQIHTSFSSYKPQDKGLLYEQFHSDYEKNQKELQVEQGTILKEIERYLIVLKVKLNRMDEPADAESLSFSADSYLEYLENCCNYIKKHNQITKGFVQHREKLEEELKNHYLASVYPVVMGSREDLKNNEEEIKNIKTSTDSENLGIDSIEKILSKDKKINPSSPACEKINTKLKNFLGRRELHFKPIESRKGFSLKRGEKIAKHISEGEKTAIALVYFLTTLKEEGFNLSDSIIVIDDPISSLDDNFVAQAFGFIKTELKDAKQVFILTHNFNFFRHVKHWLRKLNQRKRKKQEDKKPAAFFMIKNDIINDNRSARLSVLDSLLLEHDSEYQYLFKLMHHTKNNSLTDIYPIPNVARKFMETFLSFEFPFETNFGSKFSLIKEDEKIDFSKEKIEKIKRFINAHSHSNIDAINKWDFSSWSEGAEVVQDVLKLTKALNKKHYDGLLKSIKPKKS